MEREEVREYVEHAQSIIDASPQMDEANTKAAVLRDFLDLLEWNIPVNTQLEYSVEAFGKTYKVDYALVLEGTPVAFLEAKGVDTSLTDKHREQLRAYLKNEDVNLGILTNGEDYEFYRRQVVDTKVNVNTLAKTDLQNLPERVTILRAFTKEAIENDEWVKILNRITELRDARDALGRDKDDLATEIAELLAENVSETLTQPAESQAKEMIDRLIDDIEGEIESPDSGGNAVAGTVRRQNISGPDNAKVAVFPSRESGLKFLTENNAWGFVRVGSKPDYVAMYLSRDVQEVRYFAKVKEIVSPEDAQLQREPETYVDREEIEDGKMVVVFEENSLYELEDPIPFKNKWPQSLQYTTLRKLRTAETTDDLFADDSKRREEPNSIEELVLEAVRENPGTSLRSIHRTVAEFEESSIEWVDEWGEARTDVQTALHNLRDMNLVRLDDRSWFPADSDEV